MKPVDPWVPFMTRSRSLLSRIIHRDPEEQCWPPWSDGQCRGLHSAENLTPQQPRCHATTQISAPRKSTLHERVLWCSIVMFCCVFPARNVMMDPVCVVWPRGIISALTNHRRVRWQNWPIRGISEGVFWQHLTIHQQPASLAIMTRCSVGSNCWQNRN